jgi:DNA-binding HxlR family transcriptional regulator
LKVAKKSKKAKRGPPARKKKGLDIPGISEKVLSQHLRDLEADGIVARREFHEGAVLATEYGFTEYGRTLIPALNALAQWGMEHQAAQRIHAM